MRKTNLLWGVLCAALLLPACKEEQTVLSLESLPTTTIEGYLTYDAGYRDNGNNQYVRDNEKPAADVPVYVMVNYAQYQSGATGTKVYEARTDATGKYSVQIYTTLNGVIAEVNPAPFEADYGRLVEANGTQSLETVRYYHQVTNPITFADTKTLPNTIGKEQSPTAYTGEEVQGTKEYPYHIVVKGVVKVQMEDNSGTENYVGQAGRQVKVYFTRQGDPEVVVMGTTAGMLGEYQVNLPIDDLSDTYDITVEAMPFQDTYYDYTNGVAEAQTGIYAAWNGVTASVSPQGFDGRTVTMADISMYFTPNN